MSKIHGHNLGGEQIGKDGEKSGQTIVDCTKGHVITDFYWGIFTPFRFY